MVTERDVYELDTKQAIQALKALHPELRGVKVTIKEVAKEVENTKAKVESFGTILRTDLKNSFFSAQAQYDLLKSAVIGTARFLASSVHEFEKSEQASMRLGFALKNAGGSAGKFRESLDIQSAALERATGVEDEYVSSIQTLLLSYGVAPALIARTTQAAFDMAVVTGSAETAARLLARADHEGKEELKKFNIEIEDGIPKGERFTAMLGKVEGAFGGLTTQIPESVKRINELKSAWSNFTETVGKGVAFTVSSLLELGKPSGVEKQLLEALKDKKDSGFKPAEVAAVQLARRLDEAEPIDITVDTAALNREAKAKRDERERKAIQDANDRFNERMNAQKIGGQDDEQDEFEKLGFSNVESWKLRLATEKFAVEESAANAQAYRDNWQRAFEAEEAKRAERLERDKIFWAGMRQNFEAYGQGLVNTWTGFFAQMLTSNTRFTKEMQEQAMERELVGLSEQAANDKRVLIEKRLADERGAAFLKVTADALASIAQQSATKAIFEGAEAVAAFARADIPSATQHGIAAGLYAGVAVAAGGGAAALSAARGTTAEERSQLESSKTREKERTEREARQTAQVTKEAGTQVNIYNLGISGKTERDQGRELTRVLNQFSDLRTGGG